MSSDQENATEKAEESPKKSSDVENSPKKSSKQRRRRRRGLGKKRKQRIEGIAQESGGVRDSVPESCGDSSEVMRESCDSSEVMRGSAGGWDSDTDDFGQDDSDLTVYNDVKLRPSEVPKAPENYSQFLMDDHDECRLYMSFEVPGPHPENPIFEEFPTGEDAAFHDVDYIYVPQMDSQHDMSAFYDSEFEAVYHNVRSQDLMQLERTQLIAGIASLEERTRELRDSLARVNPSPVLSQLQTEFLEQQERNSMLREQNARLRSQLHGQLFPDPESTSKSDTESMEESFSRSRIDSIDRLSWQKSTEDDWESISDMEHDAISSSEKEDDASSVEMEKGFQDGDRLQDHHLKKTKQEDCTSNSTGPQSEGQGISRPDCELESQRDSNRGPSKHTESETPIDMDFVSQRHSELCSQGDSELEQKDLELGSQRVSEPGSFRDSELEQKDLEVGSQRGSEPGSLRDSELDSQRDSELGSQRDSELESQKDPGSGVSAPGTPRTEYIDSGSIPIPTFCSPNSLSYSDNSPGDVGLSVRTRLPIYYSYKDPLHISDLEVDQKTESSAMDVAVPMFSGDSCAMSAQALQGVLSPHCDSRDSEHVLEEKAVAV